MTHSSLALVPDLPPEPLDPDDTSACPTADNCEVCGEGELIRAATALTPLGLLCLTICDDCAERGARAARIASVPRRVCAHAEHLGASIDDVAAAVAAR